MSRDKKAEKARQEKQEHARQADYEHMANNPRPKTWSARMPAYYGTRVSARETDGAIS